MGIKTLPAAAGDWLKHESDPRYTRDAVTLLSTGTERTVASGTVLGRIVAATPAVATAAGGNVGNGAMGAVAVGLGASAGTYRLTIVEAASNAGRFVVTAPDGRVVGLGQVAAAFVGGGLSFTLADGATDFAVGDAFAIAVAAGSGFMVELDPDGLLGSERPAAILVDPVTVPAAGNAAGLALMRGPALVRADGLVWPEDYDDGDKAAGGQALAALGIISRSGA